MKKISVFLLVTGSFLLGSVIATGLVWYLVVLAPLQDTRTSIPEEIEPTAASSTGASKAVTESGIAASLDTTPVDVSAEAEFPIIVEAVTIPLGTLTESQQVLARTLGVVTEDSIIITPAAQQCAFTILGDTRVLEIIDGATPTIREGLTLVNCLSG